ncbi:MAG: HNH endonuclease [Candidatus Competibacteraceae bacterium]|nr:HNH endonuclease [Candidatus Competibacteraceae bacterium]
MREAIRVGYNYRRMQTLKRDNYACTSCGVRHNLEVHHKSPRSKERNDKLENLITLCNTCHGKEHGR